MIMLTPMSELDELARSPWGNIPQLLIPPDWRTKKPSRYLRSRLEDMNAWEARQEREQRMKRKYRNRPPVQMRGNEWLPTLRPKKRKVVNLANGQNSPDPANRRIAAGRSTGNP